MATLFGLARLGRDAELRTAGTDVVTNLSLAFTRRVKGEKLTDWVDGSLWGKRAESLAPYLLKGAMLAVTIEDIHIETYQGKSGEGHKLAGRVTNIELAGGGQMPAPAPKPAPKPKSDFSDMDDSIPF